MPEIKEKRRRFGKMALALLLALAMLAGAAPAAKAGGVQEISNLVIMVRFADETEPDIFAANWGTLRDMYEKTDGRQTDSLKRYLSLISGGKANVTSYFPQEQNGAVTALTLPASLTRSSADYEIIMAVAAAYQGATLGNGSAVLDHLLPGILDNLTILVQGSASSTSESIYPHKSNLGGGTTIFGKEIFNYNIINSEMALEDTLMRQGVISHEFLHTLGLPDLYRYNLYDSGAPVGRWDIMAATSIYMQYPLAYLRSQLGWLTLDTITASGTYTLDWVGAESGTRGFRLATPLSTSEFFVLEYRVKPENSSENIQSRPIDFKIPGSGLLMYRVNPQVPGASNAGGQNYIYIFRPDVTDPDAATENINEAAVDPSSGETSYGSADLSAPFTANTLYYSDGRNSGLTLSNIHLVENGAKLQFDVTFPDYSTLDLWESVGGSVTSASGAPSLAVDGSGTVYAACEDSETFVSRTTVRQKLSDGSWAQVGEPISGMSDPQLLYRDGGLFLLGAVDASSAAACFQLADGAWRQVCRYAPDSGSVVDRLRFVSSPGGRYASFLVGNTLCLLDLSTGALLSQSPLPAAGSASNPAVAQMNGVFYAAYLDFASPSAGYLAQLGEGGWSNIQTLDSHYNTYSLCTDGSRLHLAASGSTSFGAELAPKYYLFDGANLTGQDIPSLSSNGDVRLVLADGVPYAGGLSGSTAKVLRLRNGSWSAFGADVSGGVSYLSLVYAGGMLYAGTTKNETGAIHVSARSTAETPPQPSPSPVPPAPGATPTPPAVSPSASPFASPSASPSVPPAVPDYTVTVTPPEGYQDATLWIDGQAYTAQGDGVRSVTLTNGQAATAAMYRYDGRGIPVGMYVWALTFADNHYTSTPLPALQDLLSYHGFSIRVEGNAGIRFKTGISAALRATLLSAGGAEGYRLAEYGTLFTNSANIAAHPFILGGDKIGSGRAYWVGGGVVNDRIFETVQGRHRFTSVIIDVPSTYYRTEFAFRGYIILEKAGQRVTFYGPVVSRSIYAVAEQVIAAGEFAAGSAGDLYVRNIINSAG